MNKRNAAFLSVLAAIAFFAGIIQQFAVRANAVLLQSGLPYGIFMLAMLFAWYKRDANERGYRRSMGLNIMVVALAIIALPYYLCRSRGFARGIAATFTFIGVMIGCAALDGIGHLVAYVLQTRS